MLSHAILSSLAKPGRWRGTPRRVLGERDLFSEHAAMPLTDDARNRRDLGEALLPDQQLQRPEATAAGGHLEPSGLVAVGVDDS